MVAKEKADELFEKFNKQGLHQISSVINRVIRKKMIIQCALIAVDEILNVIEDNCLEYDDNYWLEVKQEIEKL
jgi:hypothetical protein